MQTTEGTDAFIENGGRTMLNIEWEDILGVIGTIAPYLIAIAVIIVAAIVCCVAVRKQAKHKKFLIRGEAVIAMLLGIILCVNMILTGPMMALINLTSVEATGVTDATIAEAEVIAENIAEEGFVLLQNRDDFLPIAPKKLNLFGWSSTNPVYGGAGSGGINALYPIVSLIEGLNHSGFEVNQELVDFYKGYAANRAEVSIQAQNWDLPEAPTDRYSAELLNNAKGYSDTAVIVISRMAGEGHNDIPQDMTQAVSYVENTDQYNDFEPGQHYLSLSRSERDMVNLVCSNFENVVFVLNSAYPMELGFTEELPQIKSVIWAPGPGNVGFNALGKIMAGTVNPSGKTNDTFVYNMKDAPYYYNAEKTDYANMTDMMVAGMNAGVPTNYYPSFINYNENVYVGYKFYETAALEGVIDYDKTVQFPFGYGLSYTSFTQTMSDLKVNGTSISFDVTVTNTGKVAGKDVVEVYFNPPYVNGGIEKASANLVRFDKTDLLAPGASQTITITLDEEDLAAYDEKGHGCYVLEAGNYVISVNSSSHTVLDSKTYTVASDVVYNASNPRKSDDTAAVNLFQDSVGSVTYLSRADHFANLAEATAAPVDVNMPDAYIAGYHLNANYDPKAYINANDTMPVTGKKSGIMLPQLRGKAYDDPMWDKLLDQLTVEEMSGMIALAGYQTGAIESIGKVQNVDCDGPAAINNNFTGQGSLGFPVEVVITCTWSQKLAHDWGYIMGKMSKEMGSTGWYAPAMNTHRSAFTARNYEYFSEDGVLAGYIGAMGVKGAMEQGVYSTIKHFAMYDSNGKMTCAWSTEQAMREIYLKPFEICVKVGGATGVMESWAFLGNKWVGELSTLNNTVLRDEWGFRGFIVSDFFRNNGHGFMNADMALANGVDAMLSTYEGGPNQVTDKTAASNVKYMRQATHNILYTTAQSWIYDEEHVNARSASWTTTLYIIDGVVVVLLLACAYMIFRKSRKMAK